ncbi:MAG: peroxidase family protein [Phycisphaerae bacterium]|nr:peroxidase family protein [Phycisphaerae bacterium]
MAKKQITGTVCALIALMCAVGVAENRTIDGSGNNVANPKWGSAGSRLLRNNGVGYTDGIWTPAGAYRPSPRVVSNAVCAQEESIPNPYGISDFLWAWGQIIDHDLAITEPGEPHEPFNITVGPGDSQFDPHYAGGVTLPANRSEYDPTTGTDINNPRQQTNRLTAWVDGSMVYGSDAALAAWLRTGNKGLLKSQQHPLYGELLPYEDGTVPHGSPVPVNAFVSGDIRTNENPVLTCMHTLLMREHNRLARLIWQSNPTWSDEKIYQTARKIVGAEIQVITYKEFLPALLGEHLPPYTGYKPHIDPMISNEFSAAAYRIGHTLLSSMLLRLDEHGREISYGNVRLGDAFLKPSLITEEGGIEPFFRGLAQQVSQRIDVYIIDDIRNILFGNQDLPALNMQRGRDHGLLDYNNMRESFGLIKYNSFEELTPDIRVRTALKSVYGDIDNIDPWVGMLAEKDGGTIGDLMAMIIRDQFIRLRDGDRFWYQYDPELTELLPWLESVRLSDVIMWNTNIKNLQKNVFYVPTKPAVDEMYIGAAYVLKGYTPGCDTVLVYGYSMDANEEDLWKCDAIKVWIYVDDEPQAVMYEAIPVKAGSYAKGTFTYRSRNASGIYYFQCDFVNKTFYVIAKKVDMSKMKKKMAVDVQIDGYYGRGETTNYVWK